MTDLHNKKCIPCRGGISSFDIAEIHKYLKKVDGWDVKNNENKNYFLEKNDELRFSGFFCPFLIRSFPGSFASGTISGEGVHVPTHRQLTF